MHVLQPAGRTLRDDERECTSAAPWPIDADSWASTVFHAEAEPAGELRRCLACGLLGPVLGGDLTGLAGANVVSRIGGAAR
ncbi:MAG: hypothetical protein NVS3B10_00490 [Polyangiales bacterium]